MKIFIIIFVSLILGFASFTNTIAMDKSNCIYGSKINQVISFYQSRLYLLDSEYKILSDIGKDAERMINCLEKSKAHLIEEMKGKKIDFKSLKMKSYIVNKTRTEVVSY